MGLPALDWSVPEHTDPVGNSFLQGRILQSLQYATTPRLMWAPLSPHQTGHVFKNHPSTKLTRNVSKHICGFVGLFLSYC